MEPREIVLVAYNHLGSVTPPTQKIGDVRLEELSPITGESGFWKVVLSYDTKDDNPFDTQREHKEFKVKVEGATGEVISMKSANAS